MSAEEEEVGDRPSTPDSLPDLIPLRLTEGGFSAEAAERMMRTWNPAWGVLSISYVHL